jgi:CheY-like chemotaxis protein
MRVIDGTGTRVLVVATGGSDLSCLCESLRDEYHLRTAANVYDALERVSSFDPDVVLLDLRLSDYGGFEVAGHLAVDRPSLPVLYVSGPDHDDDLVDGFLLGGDRYLRLPDDAAALSSRIEESARGRALLDGDPGAHGRSAPATSRAGASSMATGVAPAPGTNVVPAPGAGVVPAPGAAPSPAQRSREEAALGVHEAPRRRVVADPDPRRRHDARHAGDAWCAGVEKCAGRPRRSPIGAGSGGLCLG